MTKPEVIDSAAQSEHRVPLDLTGRVALVTGGTRGIGHDICRAFLGAGAKVALCSRDGAAAERTASELGQGARGYACDVGVAAQVEAFAKSVEKDFGQIDVLVNNAGFTKDTLLFLMTESDWDSVLDTNLKGTFLMTKYAARGMIKRRWGRVIMITSQAARTKSMIAGAHYAASKTGLMGFARSLAGELGPFGITVNSIAPGRIETPMAQGAAGGQNEAFLANIPVGRLGTPADVAEVAAFLASDAASYLNGTTIDVGGGSFMP